jgi:hypothetical protein
LKFFLQSNKFASPEDKRLLNNLDKKFNKSFTLHKREWESKFSNLGNNNSPRSYWQFTKSVKNSHKQHNSPLKSKKIGAVYDEEEKAEDLTQCFLSQYPPLTISSARTTTLTQLLSSFSKQAPLKDHTNFEEVQSIIDTSTNRSLGPDDITNIMLKKKFI